MPSYFFHIAVELYQRPPLEQQSLLDYPPEYTPSQNLDIPNSLAAHSVSPWTANIAPRRRCSFLTTRSGFDTRNKSARDFIPERSQNDIDKQSLVPEVSDYDWRFDKISLETIDMAPTDSTMNGLNKHISTCGGLAIRGKYSPSNLKTTELGWGVVHLYRDGQASQELDDSIAGDGGAVETDEDHAFIDSECTTLCILAVPSYMTPPDLLGWIGEEGREQVSHFRLIRTARSNKYMVLLKFRDSKHARQWQSNWNGKLFSAMEPENCHVVFVRSIQFQTPDANYDPTSFPDMTNDPFTPAVQRKFPILPSSASNPTLETARITEPAARTPLSTSLTAKPAPPPTASLIELPTCPVCLERMDETTGLATIFCQHVFHCACLQKWRGSGCPVCRYTQGDPAAKRAGASLATDECNVCRATDNLWICLICGHVGCGRYDEAHAFAHYETTGHSFAMDTATQHVWDYAGDGYVHRLIQNKSDGKLVELPSADNHDKEQIPEDKTEHMSLEYTYLLTSQLDSQRMYFEEQVDRAVDKASKASAAAERAAEVASKAVEQLNSLQRAHDTIIHETLPSLERSKERSDRRAEKLEVTARKMEKESREREVINESLMDRIAYLEKQVHDATLKNSDLEEQNRDLSFFISGMEKLKGQGTDVQEGTVTVGDAPESGKKKKKGKK